MVPQRTDIKAELPGCLRMAVECLQGWAMVMHLQTLWELENKAGIALGLCAEAAACSERAVPFSAFISQPGQLLLLVLGSVGAHQGCGNICNEPEFRGDRKDSLSQWSVPWQFCTLPSDTWCTENAHLRWSTSSSARLFFFLFRLVQ